MSVGFFYYAVNLALLRPCRVCCVCERLAFSAAQKHWMWAELLSNQTLWFECIRPNLWRALFGFKSIFIFFIYKQLKKWICVMWEGLFAAVNLLLGCCFWLYGTLTVCFSLTTLSFQPCFQQQQQAAVFSSKALINATCPAPNGKGQN